jgi:hypothetical protein
MTPPGEAKERPLECGQSSKHFGLGDVDVAVAFDVDALALASLALRGAELEWRWISH